ncbi:PLP-dependent aminotransferase family protein [Burkholderia guangdongensis]|uniref:MocR-like pyridoxine biosynthesis transcription factor PdxR n=1 Tax=Burkholderia guangdongensis TaxID=1792500 RepID=UPI0015C81C9A|nr:PLP-dependent aminotransferase family protein [Burkholderia guangdongensis]
MDLDLLVAAFAAQKRTAGYSQQDGLYRCIRDALLDGKMPPGTRLPSTRTLAQELGIARNSVVYAYERLADEGFVATTRAGTVTVWGGRAHARDDGAGDGPAVRLADRVAGLENPHAEPERMAPFVPGLPSLDDFPLAQWRRSIERAWRSIGPAQLAYGPPEGMPELRRAVAAYIRVSRGVRCETAQVFITDGTQSSLELCARMLANPGENGWLENPCYSGARTAFRSTGLRIVPVEVDGDGMAPTDAQWRDSPPRLIYVTPSHQYPLGSLMSLRRRSELLDRARAHDAWIIEDDYDSEFRRGGQPLPAIQGLSADARVCYLGTFSKTMFPGLRLGFMVIPPMLVDRFGNTLRELVHRGHSAEQLAMADFIESGLFARHLRKMRTLYAHRRDCLDAMLARHLGGSLTVRANPGGMHLSAELTVPLSDADVARYALAQRLRLHPLSGYRVGDGRAYNGFVLGYAGLREPVIEHAAAQFGRLVEQLS